MSDSPQARLGMRDAPLVQPAAVRLYSASTHTIARVPFGLPAWSDDEAAALVVPLSPAEDVAELARELPDPSSLAPGALVIAMTGTPAPRGLFGRLFTRAAPISRHARATALLARGYVEIAAAVDGSDLDLVWGRAAPAAHQTAAHQTHAPTEPSEAP